MFSKMQSSYGVNGLGFVSFSQLSSTSNTNLKFCFKVIQSEYSTSYLDDRIEAFIAWAEVFIHTSPSKIKIFNLFLFLYSLDLY